MTPEQRAELERAIAWGEWTLGIDASPDELARMRALITAARERLASSKARPLDEWHEDIGPVLWWHPDHGEPPYSGTPHDNDWPGYHTHWTHIIEPDIWDHFHHPATERGEGEG